MNRYALIGMITLALGGAIFGWYRTEIKRAKQQGIAEMMTRQSQQDRQRFDSAVRSDSIYRVAAAARVARLVRDSTENDQARQLLAIAAGNASQRADSVAAEIRTKFPELAGQVAVMLAARDTARLEAIAERNGRLIAEQLRTECEAAHAATERLLETSKVLIGNQAATIDQLQKLAGSGGGIGPVLAAVLVVGSVAAGVGLAAIIP